MKQNLFDLVKPNIFSVFASKDRRSNFDLLNKIYEIFLYGGNVNSFSKEQLQDDLTAYISGRDFESFTNLEGENISNKSAREKATSKIRQFTLCGWLEEESASIHGKIYSLNFAAIRLLQTFSDMLEEEERPIEYSGYFYTVYRLLTNFEYDKSKSTLEQIVTTTKSLSNSLQGLTSSIHKYISCLMDRKDLTPKDVLNLLLFKYQDQVMLTVFNNLKTKDNPNKFVNTILEKLYELRNDRLDELVANYLLSVSGDKTQDRYLDSENHIKEQLDFCINCYERIDDVIKVIDRKNEKFHSTAIATLNFLLNTRRDVEGQIAGALRALKDVSKDEDFDSIIPLYSSLNIDEKSLYSRSFNKEKVTVFKSERPIVDEEEFNKELQKLLKEDIYSKRKIDDLTLSFLADKDHVALSTVTNDGFEDVINAMMIMVYSQYDEMSYSVDILNENISIAGYVMKDLMIIRRRS